MSAPRTAAYVTLAVVAVAVASALRARPAEVRGAAPAGPERLGVATCATAGCHHGNGRPGAKGSEYTTWLVDDPHARAYDVLLNERSALIERNLRGLKDGKEAHAEGDALCLNCHVQPDALKAPRGPRFALADGVGCESCHGPAQQWLRPHTTWHSLAPDARKRAYAEHGMTWLQDPVTRVEVCVACHVGTPQADVNHDLIAAGHPRLTFEFASFQAHMPRHWDAKAERARSPDFEARAWAVGQVACARAALELLAARTERTWPEFAEYNCFACHKELRGRRPAPEAVRGQAAWASWPYALLPEALAFGPGEANAEVKAEVDALGRLMRRPLPPTAVVARQARATANRLGHWLDGAAQGKYGDAALLAQTREAIMKQDRAGGADWDAAMQRYLGMAALYQAQRAVQREPPDADFRKYLDERAKQLQFPPGYNGPHEAGRE